MIGSNATVRVAAFDEEGTVVRGAPWRIVFVQKTAEYQTNLNPMQPIITVARPIIEPLRLP